MMKDIFGLFLFLLICVIANGRTVSATTFTPSSLAPTTLANPQDKAHEISLKSAAIVLICAIIFLACLSIYIRRCTNPTSINIFDELPVGRPHPPYIIRRGLNSTIIKT
ncbi:hypothetical protein A4A49_39672 [Nicotiana attenuata]|uniref:Uncharacterized protein n=1 Tax=Nicotiana attenuata TaxID=49451 RepID=A0A1J6ILA0_NICAT|nr:hypothetical protein A4A49_39672 [Nicotiana attenuata]